MDGFSFLDSASLICKSVYIMTASSESVARHSKDCTEWATKTITLNIKGINSAVKRWKILSELKKDKQNSSHWHWTYKAEEGMGLTGLVFVI